MSSKNASTRKRQRKRRKEREKEKRQKIHEIEKNKGNQKLVSSCLSKCRYTSYNEAVSKSIDTSACFGKPMRIYKCSECNGYHITSKVDGRRVCKF